MYILVETLPDYTQSVISQCKELDQCFIDADIPKKTGKCQKKADYSIVSTILSTTKANPNGLVSLFFLLFGV